MNGPTSARRFTPMNTPLWIWISLALVAVATIALWTRTARADLLAEGTRAPAFTLPNQDGTPISSHALKGGWWVLYFYPKDDTPGCTKEACTFRDQIDDLNKLGVRVLGVSFDDVASHRAFADKHGLPFDLLADPKGVVIGLYKARSPVFRTFAKRVSYLMDDDGIIRRVYPNVSPAEHAGEILADVARFTGRAAPPDWPTP